MRRLLCCVLLSLALLGCEDDPILGPDQEEPDGGSYGVLHFRTAPDSTEAPALPSTNPARF